MGQLEKLNENIEKLIGLLQGYPNPIDVKLEPERQNAETLKAAQEKAVAETSAPSQAHPVAESTHSMQDLTTLAKNVMQSNPASKAQIKELLNELGVPKITATPTELIDTFYEKLQALGQ